jgi:signal transduction histidine kinase
MPAQASRGFGLSGMEERVRALGGSFSVSSAAGGTTVAILMPATGASLRGRIEPD